MKRKALLRVLVWSELFADSESNNGGVVSGEEVLVARLQFPQFPLGKLLEPRALQTLLRLI